MVDREEGKVKYNESFSILDPSKKQQIHHHPAKVSSKVQASIIGDRHKGSRDGLAHGE